MGARLIVICLDGADGRMLDAYSADGSLPNLTALRQGGAAKPLSAPLGSTDDALWASFQYALPVGEHGRYAYRTPQKNDRFSKAHETERLPTFWDGLSRQGMQVAVIDVPKCRPPASLNGMHVVDWLTHGEYFGSPASYPSDLTHELLETYGSRPSHLCNDFALQPDGGVLQQLVANAKREVAMKVAAGRNYLLANAWDLFCIGFSQLHCVDHNFWDFERSPSFAELRRENHPIGEVLALIDEAIGSLMAAAGPSAECVVFAPTDFERNGSLAHLMPDVVARINRELSQRFAHRASIKAVTRNVLRRLARRKPREWPCTLLPYNENCLALRVAATNDNELYRDVSAALPDAALVDAVEQELLDLRTDSGERLDLQCARPSQTYRGRQAKNLPDLLLHFPGGYLPNGVRSARFGRIEQSRPSWRPGNHRDGGFIVAAGCLTNRYLPDVHMISDIGKMATRALSSA